MAENGNSGFGEMLELAFTALLGFAGVATIVFVVFGFILGVESRGLLLAISIVGMVAVMLYFHSKGERFGGLK